MSSTVAAWISGRVRDTRSSGMPRMRSASMPLLGLVETRMSFRAFSTGSRAGSCFFCCFATTAYFLLGGAEGLNDANPERRGCGDGREAPAEEAAQPALDGDARFAVGTVAQVDLDALPFVVAEGTVEEEVDDTFHIV